MSELKKSNRGFYHPNPDKKPDNKQPDFKGELKEKEQDVLLSIWKNVSKGDDKKEYFSIIFNNKGVNFKNKPADPDKENNRGVLFPNTKTKDGQPDFRGKGKINSTNYFIAVWEQDKDGGISFSVALTEITEDGQPNNNQNEDQNHDQTPNFIEENASQDPPFDNNSNSDDDFDIFNFNNS